MRLPLRPLLLLLIFLALPFGLFFWWTGERLRPELEGLLLEELERDARLLTELVGSGPLSDSLADRLGEISGLRVTLVDETGTVVGDSEVPARRLPRIENHADRPEVGAALRDSVGRDRRASRSVARSLFYVAIPRGDDVLRVATPTAPVDDRLARARQMVFTGALVVFLLAFVLSRAFDRLAGRPLRELVEAVRALGDIPDGDRHRQDTRGPFGELARAINEAGDELQARLGALERESAELRALFESLEEGLAVVGRDGTVLRANPGFQRWVGREEVVGEPIATLFRDPANLAAVREALAGGSGRHESELRGRTVVLRTRPHDEGAALLLRDLTRTRRLEGMRRDFVANVSHELKTPLTSIRGFAEALAEGDLPPDQATHFVERIGFNAARMQRLVDDLLDLARIESGSWTPEPREVEIAAIAHEAWTTLLPRTEARHVSLEIEDGDPQGTLVPADPDALRQILQNLLDNAVRYSEPGGTVRLRIREEAGGVRIEVADDGPGITSEHVQRVFERFYRVDAARSREEGGTGLGLSIVKHLVAAHGGEVGIESEVGRGTTVWFRVPRD